MRIRGLWRFSVLGCLALCVCVPAFARKVFPANHMSVILENRYADEAGVARFETAAEVNDAVARGILVSVPIVCSTKLPEFRRFVRPSAARFVLELDSRFHGATGHYLIVDSAVRPVEVQKRLARRNRSAAPATGERASSHERGTTVDLARKTFGYNGVSRIGKSQYRMLLCWLAYYQAVGRIHVIEERACLHVMVRE